MEARDEFYKSLSKKKTGIKALLLDQSFVSGIGNWIADEVLYQARIHPMQNAASISKESCAALHKCIKEVIHYAVKVDADCSHFPLDCLRDAQGFQFLLCPTPGYFVVDMDSTSDKLVFNRIVTSRVKYAKGGK